MALTGANDPAVSVKAVIGVYGVYDMIAQWEHDLSSRPRDSIAEAWQYAEDLIMTLKESDRMTAMTALMVMLNTVAKEITKNEEK